MSGLSASAEPSSLEQALLAIEAPLRFAARGDFAHFDRVRDLEPTLLRGAERLLKLLPTGSKAHGVVQQLAASLQAPPTERQARIELLRTAQRGLAALRMALSASVAGPASPSPPKSRRGNLAEPGSPATASPPKSRRGNLAEPGSPPTAQPGPPPTEKATQERRAATGMAPIRNFTAAPPPAVKPAQAVREDPKFVSGAVAGAKQSGAPAPNAVEGAPAPNVVEGDRAPDVVEGAAAPDLQAPLQFLKGVGPKAAEALASRGLKTVADLLHFLPRRYQPRSGVQHLSELAEGVAATVEAEVYGVSQRNMRGRRSLEVVLTDGSGALHLVWFRIPGKSFMDQFKRGQRLRASGVVKHYRGRLQMVHPQTTIVPDMPSDDAGLDDDIVPLYLDVDGLHPNQLRRIIEAALPAAVNLPDPLPQSVRHKRGWLPLGEAYAKLHTPPPDTSFERLSAMQTPWQQRLIYDELLLLQLAVLRGKAATQSERGQAMPLTMPLTQQAQGILPFTLTDAQARVLGDIEADLRRPVPMQRLLQGDVGSGKTAVALTAAAGAARLGLQTAIMAPTELLAEQHARTALKMLTPAGFNVALLTGGMGAAERRQVLHELQAGNIHVIVGTHALIQDSIVFKALALGIIDEQHRFGVMQRARLKELGHASLGATPHMLVMTATPIPRTLALTVYGDLDVSVIDALPPGRSPIRTRTARDAQRPRVYEAVRHAVVEGRQAYVVFPLVEESDKEGMDKLRDATSAVEELQAGPLHGLRLGLLHGRLTSDEKDHVMRAFAARELDVLVATTVIEVGIDVPNATVMVIENAERFGLSQLHQLRGRVGRGAHASACYLIASPFASEEAWRRLAVMEQSTDGFRIAEEDLAIRGPGDFVGTRQAGMPMLSMANLARDQAVLALARQDAQTLLAADPNFTAPEHAALRRALDGDARLSLAQVG